MLLDQAIAQPQLNPPLLPLHHRSPGTTRSTLLPGNRLAEQDVIPQGTYAALREVGYVVKRAVESVRSRPASDTERKALRLPKGAPALAVERVSFYGDGQPIELLETVADATRVIMQHSIDL